MALFTKIFGSNRKNRKLQLKGGILNLPKADQTARGLTPQSRLVLFQDHHDKGRIVLFDSEARKNIESQQIQRQSSDTKMLGEMMFGSVPMVYRGASLKIHVIRSPPQLMVTKVFIPNPPHNIHKDGISEPANYDADSLNGSTSESMPKQINGASKGNNSVAHSIPVDVPIQRKTKADEDEEQFDSGILTASGGSLGGGRSTEIQPSPGSSRSSSVTSSNSLKRRWTRSQATSFEHSLRIVFGDEIGEVLPLVRQRATKLGLGVIFMLPEDSKSAENRHFQHFFFSHITLIESHINKLVAGIEQAVFNKREYFQIILQTLDQFRKCVDDLYRAPRIPNPVWLTMIRHPAKRLIICHHFLNDFMMLVEKYDTKSTNFFVSTVVTAVLTSHLAWVPTVTPTGVCPSRNYVSKHSAKWLDTLAKSHPYNPLWAQLGDLYGALGYPLKLGRTVVVGKKSDVVSKFLHILSYFIRCSEVHENVEQKLTEELVKTPESMEDSNDISCETGDTGGKYSWTTSSSSPFDYKLMHLSANGDINDVIAATVPSSDSQTESLHVHKSDHNISEYNSIGINQKNLATKSLTCQSCSCSEQKEDIVARQCCSPQSSPSASTSPSVLSLRISATDAAGNNRQDKGRDSQIGVGTTCEKSPTAAEENVKFERIRHIGRSSVFVSPDNSEKTTDFLVECSSCKSQQCSAICAAEKKISGSCPHVGSRSSKCEKERHTDTAEIEDVTPQLAQASVNDSSTCLNIVNEKDFVSKENDEEDLKCGEEPHARIPKMIRVPLSMVTTCSNPEYSSVTNLRDIGDQHDQLNENALSSASKETEGAAHNVYDTDRICQGNPRTLLRILSNQSTSSMFDEYFENENQDAIFKSPSKELAKITFLSKRVTSVESNASLFDEYIDEPFPSDLANSDKSTQKYKGQFTMESDSVMFDEYYSDQSASLPNVTVGADDMVNSGERGTVRPGSLSLRLEMADKETTLARQTSLSPTNPMATCDTGLRRRHVSNKSAVSAISSVSTEGCEHLQEIMLPKSNIMEDDGSRRGYERNFGCSLLAGISDHYLSDFVLHGTTDTDFEAKLEKDLSMALLYMFGGPCHSPAVSRKQNPVLDEPISEAVCTIANTDDWSVKRKSCQGTQADQHKCTTLAASHLVTSIIESVHDLWKLKMAPEFCLMHLEDRLQEIYFKSQMVAKYICTHNHLEASQLVSNLGVDLSDLQLLLAVASTHCEGPPFSGDLETT